MGCSCGGSRGRRESRGGEDEKEGKRKQRGGGGEVERRESGDLNRR